MTRAAGHSEAGGRREPIPGDAPASEVLDLILARVRLRAGRREAWLSHLAAASGGARIEGACLAGDAPEAEAAWYERAESEELCAYNTSIEQVERALEGPGGVRLRRLRDLFGLGEEERDVLATCLALDLDPSLGAVYARLQGPLGRPCATGPLAARLFGHGLRAVISPSMPLSVWELVRRGEAAPGEPAPLTCDPIVQRWLQGEVGLDAALVGVVHEVPKHEPLSSWAVAEVAGLVRRVLAGGSGVRLHVVGPAGNGRRTFAAAVAARLGLRALAVDTGALDEADFTDVYLRAQRLAVLTGAALVWHGSGLSRAWPLRVGASPVQMIARDAEQRVAPYRYLTDLRVDLDLPTIEEGRRLWDLHLSSWATWPEAARARIVARHRLAPADVAAITKRRPATADEALAMCREATRHHFGELGSVLECPFRWGDLVLPDRLREALEELAFEAKERAAFWESARARRLFPRGTGLIALLTGPPGTGKTMAAQVLAAELGLDLLRVDLAAVVSKFIGETAKNLKQIFERTARTDAIVLFDECDALFTARTKVEDAHDRHANADTSYLLQLLEDHRGIVVMATNKKGNIDPAFIRRLRFVLDFPRPDAEQRRRIWQNVLGELCGDEAAAEIGPALAALAAQVDVSGAQIKGALLATVFLAKRSGGAVTLEHLVRGLDRELGKEGRSIGPRERERLLRHVQA